MGDGSAPVISIEPESFDSESVLVGCEESLDVTITNIGDVELVIDQIDYFVTYPADFAIENYEDTYGTLPWILAPGDIVILQVYYYPTDVDVDAGVIEVHSNDSGSKSTQIIQDRSPLKWFRIEPLKWFRIEDHSNDSGSKSTQMI